MPKKTFRFKVTYFKPSGKYYTDGHFDLEVDACGPTETPYMQQAVDHVKALRDGPPCAMPGLATQWRGYILIDCEHGFPCLIPALVCDTE